MASNGRQFYTPPISSCPFGVLARQCWLKSNQPMNGNKIGVSGVQNGKLQKVCKTKRMDFRIADEARIRDKTLENIKFLERYKRSNCDQHQLKNLRMTLQEKGPLCLKGTAVIHNLSSENVVLIRHLLAVRLVDCDISKLLDDFTLLWIPNHE